MCLCKAAPSESEREEDIGGGVACAKQIHSSHPMTKDGKRRSDDAGNLELSLAHRNEHFRLCLWKFSLKHFFMTSSMVTRFVLCAL